MKLVLVFVSLLTITLAQRPPYAGSRPIGRPELASRFKDQEESSSTITLNNRVAEDGTTARIPVDARGDGVLVDRLNQWPREHRPFWLLNADHIEAARNPQQNNQQNLQSRFAGRETIPVRPDPPRSSFLGPLN